MTHHEQIAPGVQGACNSLLQAASEFALDQHELAYLSLTNGAQWKR